MSVNKFKKMKTKRHYTCLLVLSFFILAVQHTQGQKKGLMDTSESPFALMQNTGIDAVSFTEGFWAERFNTTKNTTVPFMWSILNDAERSHAFRNFEIAAGLKEGTHEGPPFHDGDFYKWLESAISVYAISRDPDLDKLIDRIIMIIGKAQRKDGYIHTPVSIEQRNHPEKKKAFADRMDFETYNMGHLMTAACLHYRVTGKKSLLSIAKKATDFLIGFYERSSPELARNAICPSHYMGVIEMYRTTHNPKYLELGKNLVEIRKLVENGTDHNQDRIPFREQTKAEGHAVRANYLYAGVADVVMETGDTTLLKPLKKIWEDLVSNKLYITGGCGALYDGVSPDGTSYNPGEIQQVHQAYGRDYQLPNLTAHNETCANIGNMLWNWRMLQLTGDARYTDIMEQTLYNSILSGISLDGKKFFYTNPLEVNKDLTYNLRWSKDREEYISLCNCCPPNLARTLAEINNYIYSVSDTAIWCHLYAGAKLSTKLPDGNSVSIDQETNYPWNGKVKFTIKSVPGHALSLMLRIPYWANGASVSVNGKETITNPQTCHYVNIKYKWKPGDIIELNLPMKPRLVEANPLVEETRNMVAVMRGPVVYCLESPDVPDGYRVSDIALTQDIHFSPLSIKIENSNITVLKGNAVLINKSEWNKNQLYRDLKQVEKKKIPVTLIPYYAWDNRGISEMSVWLPVR
jgi:hypothetical protein